MSTPRHRIRPRHPAPPAPRARRFSGDDGSLVVELAMVAPLMVVLLLGIFEFGTVWRNENLLSSALRGAGRVESQQSQATTADQLAIQTFAAATAQMRNVTLKRLVIYDAPTTGNVYGPCTTTDVTTTPLGPHGRPTTSPNPPVAGINCNVYSPQQVSAVVNGTAPATAFGCGASSWDQFYCPSQRSNDVSDPDLIGVWAQYTYTDVTNLFPTSTMTITDSVVYTIQPDV